MNCLCEHTFLVNCYINNQQCAIKFQQLTINNQQSIDADVDVAVANVIDIDVAYNAIYSNEVTNLSVHANS